MEHENDVFLHQIDEKILCYHGPIIYEAKIIKAQYLKEKGPYYYVHYIGWKQTIFIEIKIHPSVRFKKYIFLILFRF